MSDIDDFYNRLPLYMFIGFITIPIWVPIYIIFWIIYGRKWKAEALATKLAREKEDARIIELNRIAREATPVYEHKFPWSQERQAAYKNNLR